MARSLIETTLKAESRKALEQGVTPEVVSRATRATEDALGAATDTPYRLAIRARSYFWAVVRRTMMRQRASGPMTSRFVIESVIADLASSGRDGASVWAEIVRGWGDRIPGDVLEEYRARLCA